MSHNVKIRTKRKFRSSEFSLGAFWIYKDETFCLFFSGGQRKIWKDWVATQADLSLRCTHTSEGSFFLKWLYTFVFFLLFHRSCACVIYRIQPNYRTVRLGFSKMLGKRVVKHVPTCTKGTLQNKKKNVKDLSIMLMRCFCMSFFFIFFIKAYVVGTHLNCIDKSMQFKWVPTTYSFFKVVDKIHGL